ncbi:beta-ketoacyl synthase N-terminal-like domain-containing protein [Arcobacteraceae bacterium]|nr:beta-ketoacyl synthase N-terminal-like domain-containing protein [Arcobacteraceae bacterium]
MKNNCYIIGKSLSCSLGTTKESIVKSVKNLDQCNYESFLEEKFKEKNFYKIDGFTSSSNNYFFEILKKVIDDALKDASLSAVDAEDLHIFLGSTSMGISINEEENEKFHNNESNDELVNIRYGFIGTFIEEYIKSKYKSLVLATACTSSINAFSYASKLIMHSKIKKAIVIGIELFNKSTYDGFSSFMLLSQENIYRPFDSRSDGIILGEGCSAVILSADKNKDDDFRYLASSNICDNYSETTSDPTGKPILQCLETTIENANIQLNDIDLIKAHATGSENNNTSESNALNTLFKKWNHKIKVTAIKPYLGHTLGASGTNEMILILYCIENGFFPACLGYQNAIEGSDFFPMIEHEYITSKVNILLNYVAFGGNNSSVIISNKS